MNKQRNQSTTGRITQGAAIAALYVALTMIVAPIAFGPVQFRISEHFVCFRTFCRARYQA